MVQSISFIRQNTKHQTRVCYCELTNIMMQSKKIVIYKRLLLRETIKKIKIQSKKSMDYINNSTLLLSLTDQIKPLLVECLILIIYKLEFQ